MNRNSWVAAGLLSVVIAIAGVGAYLGHLDKKIIASNARADVADRRAATAEAELPGLKADKEVLSLSNKRLTSDLHKALSRLAAVKDAPPVPETAPEVELQLATAGLPTKVVLVGESSLVLADARMALQWHGEALRLPSALEAIRTRDEALVAHTALSNGLRSELAKCEEFSSTTLTALTERKVEVVELRTANEALAKKASLSVWVGNVKVVGAVAVTAFVTWKLARR